MPAADRPTRIVVGISGSSGAIYGARLVEVLAGLDGVECHLVMSKAARMTIAFERMPTKATDDPADRSVADSC